MTFSSKLCFEIIKIEIIKIERYKIVKKKF